MKRITALLLALALLICATAALAEDSDADSALQVNTLIENGSFIVQIPVEEGDEGWWADDMAQDDSIVKLYSGEVIEDTFVARYDPVGDGDVTVGVYHFYTDNACDKAMTWDLRVNGGAVQEVVGGSNAEAPAEEDLDLNFSGEWVEKDTQLSRLSVIKNPARGWDVEVVSAASQGSYFFTATVCYDCAQDAFVYDKGKFYAVPITDSEDFELGEPLTVGATGRFQFEDEDEEELTLRWYNDQSPEEQLLFTWMEDDEEDDEEDDKGDAKLVAKADAGDDEDGGELVEDADVDDSIFDEVDTSGWSYYTFEGSGVAMKLPADFGNDDTPPAEGVFYNGGNKDVVLQVIPTDETFTDIDALSQFYEDQEYVDWTTPVTINGVELVYAEGADDGANVYSVISAEGTTYQFVFLPQSDQGQDIIDAISATICSSDSIPE